MRHPVGVLGFLIGVSLVAHVEGQYSDIPSRLSDHPRDGTQASLSPDGSMAALAHRTDLGAKLEVHTFATGELQNVAVDLEDRTVEGCAWKSSARLLCQATGGRSGSVLLVVDLDGSPAREVGKIETLLHALPDDAANVVVERGRRVGKLHLDTGKFRPDVARADYPPRNGLRGIVDGQGVLRVRRGYSGWLALPAIDSPWIVLHADEHSGIDWFEPLAFDERANEALYIDTHEGRLALFAAKLEGQRTTRRVVLALPSGHVVNVTTLGKYPRPAEAVVFDGQAYPAPLDTRVTQVRDAVRRTFPHHAVVRMIDEDWNQRHYLVGVTDRRGIGKYYRYDSTEQRLDLLAPTHAKAVEQEPSPRTSIRFGSAHDGDATAFATLPAGTQAPPLVVALSGTSNATDQIVPLIVAMGYAVLELPPPPVLPHGTGLDIEAVTRDIRAAVRALAETHAIDATRVCAVGTEYGAYTALLHAIDDPTLRCVVGIEAVVNPEWKEATSLRFEGPPMSASVLLVDGYAMGGVPRLRKNLADAGVHVELVEYWTDYDPDELRDAFGKKLAEFLELNLR